MGREGGGKGRGREGEGRGSVPIALILQFDHWASQP